jgi:hypothetical protein
MEDSQRQPLSRNGFWSGAGYSVTCARLAPEEATAMSQPARKLLRVLVALTLSVAATLLVQAQDQTPEILSVGQVVAGAQRTETLYAYTMGKWSDADDHLAVLSTEIQCYERFGFCDEAEATYFGGQAGVTLTSLDILRWDKQELVAIDSSPICVVNTLRFDFAARKVTITMSPKGETKDPFCKDVKATTAFLGGVKDEIRKNIKKLRK